MNYSNFDCRLRATAAKITRVFRRKPRKPARVRKALAAITSAAALLVLSATASAQFVLQPNEAASKDAKAYKFFPDLNLQSNLGTVGPGAGDHEFKSLIQFNLAALPYSSGEISLATLELYCFAIATIPDANDQAISGSGPGTVSLYEVTTPWTEVGVTWNTFPTYAASPEDIKFVGASGQWYAFDVTSIVQDWHAGTVANNGLAIIMDSKFGQVTLLDADGQAGVNPGLAPRLTVVPEPGSALLAVVGASALVARRRRIFAR